MTSTQRPTAPNSLAATARAGVVNFFETETAHKPTTAMLEALYDVARVIEDMADGDCDPLFYLSSIDPGVGKTTALQHSLMALIKSPKHQHVGALVCVSRLNEIPKIASKAGLEDHQYAVFTSVGEKNKEYNDAGLGRDRTDDARILFTTQQMVESRCASGRLFQDIEEFHYKGEPRAVRVWDEAFLPAQALTVNRSMVLRLAADWLEDWPTLGSLADNLASDLQGLSDEATITLPDFENDSGVDRADVLSLLSARWPNQQSLISAATTLWLLSGKAVVVRKDTSVASEARSCTERPRDSAA